MFYYNCASLRANPDPNHLTPRHRSSTTNNNEKDDKIASHIMLVLLRLQKRGPFKVFDVRHNLSHEPFFGSRRKKATCIKHRISLIFTLTLYCKFSTWLILFALGVINGGKESVRYLDLWPRLLFI